MAFHGFAKYFCVCHSTAKTPTPRRRHLSSISAPPKDQDAVGSRGPGRGFDPPIISISCPLPSNQLKGAKKTPKCPEQRARCTAG